MVIGATQSGYIIQWDIRAKTTPVQKSTLAEDGHHNPIFCLGIVGTKNANKIVSMSNDSKICQWHSGELNNPKIHFKLFKDGQAGYNQQTDYKMTNPAAGGHGVSWQDNQAPSIRCNTMDFPEDETDKFYVGADNYNIYQASLHASNNQSQ